MGTVYSKQIFFFLSLLLASFLYNSQAASVIEPGQLFKQAAQAYDEESYDKAVILYTQLIGAGHISAPVLYNLGNAYARTGRPGLAVLCYRRAWHLDPGDPAILANIGHIQIQNGAISSVKETPLDLWRSLPVGVWAFLTTLAYWLLAIALITRLVDILPEKWLFRVFAPLCCLLLVSSIGLWSWSHLSHRPEWVVLASGQEVLFAPLDEAQAHFPVPQGSIVSLLEQNGEWIKIRVDGKQGWLKADTGSMVTGVPYL